MTSADRDLAATNQQQFLSVLSRDAAEARYWQAIHPQPLGVTSVSLGQCRGRVLARDISSPIDVPGFDRSNVDGFAVRAEDVAGAMEESPRRLRLNPEVLLPGRTPQHSLQPGTATPISTGGMVPRGANAVVMIEFTESFSDGGESWCEVRRSVAPGEAVTFAGSDIARGETVLWRGQVLSSREIGVLAALGLSEVEVFRRPRVGIISTGDEIFPPGTPLPLGGVYDSNAAILSEAVAEAGGEPVLLGVVRDDLATLQKNVEAALDYDLVLLSGGTSKGAGDLCYQIVSQWTDPGIVVHGVALKPGKPICLAATRGKPVIVLPGFPTSAIFTFHEFVAPIIRRLAGLPPLQQEQVPARLPQRVNSDRGRTEYLLVRLFDAGQQLTAYPLGKGSGAVTTFSEADGFITIPAHREILEADELVEVTLLDRQLTAADLVVIGSHCLQFDALLSQLREQGFRVRSMHVGSQGGVRAVQRAECDIAGIHLFDPVSGTYNQTFVPQQAVLIPGYARQQCFICREDDARFNNCTGEEALERALADPECVLVNRNPGSGTRILLDQYLQRAKLSQLPAGYGVQVKSHNAVAAAIAQGRADWGCAIDTVAQQYNLRALPLQPEQYDFLIPQSRLERPAVQAFLKLLESARKSLGRGDR